MPLFGKLSNSGKSRIVRWLTNIDLMDEGMEQEFYNKVIIKFNYNFNYRNQNKWRVI